MVISGVMSYTFLVDKANKNDSNGFIDLMITGFVNPKSIGKSTSFKININIPYYPGTTTPCSGCTIAAINNNLFA